MARGTWLSEEEKAEILQMRASGMTTAQIASQTQRGAKTIQRVVSGKFSSAPARGSPVATAAAVDGEGGLPPTILQIPPLSRDHGCVEQAQTPQTTPSQKHAQQTVTASEMPREAIYTPQAGRTEAVRTSANCEQRTVQNVKLPKRPKKLTRKLTTSTSDFSVNLKQPNQSPRAISTTGSLLGTAQSITIQRPQTSTTSVQPVAARAGCALNSPCPATGQDRSARSIGGNRQQISVVPAEQATTTARGEQALREPLPSSDAATNPPRFQSQQPVRAESGSEVYRRSTTSGGPSVIPVNHLQQLLDETSEQQFVSMANLVSDDDSDDDIHVRSQPQTTATMFAHHQVEAQGTPRQSNTVMAMVRDRRRVQSVAQFDAGRFKTNAMESPLLSFEAQLRSSQGSSWATPVSQIEPEPIITKKRKLETSGAEEAKSDPVERALAIFSETLTSTTKNPKLSFYEDRLALLFQRFQADVRLVELEKREALTRLPNDTLSSC